MFSPASAMPPQRNSQYHQGECCHAPAGAPAGLKRNSLPVLGSRCSFRFADTFSTMVLSFGLSLPRTWPLLFEEHMKPVMQVPSALQKCIGNWLANSELPPSINTFDTFKLCTKNMRASGNCAILVSFFCLGKEEQTHTVPCSIKTIRNV